MAIYTKGLARQAMNCIRNALMPFKKETQVSANIVVTKYKNPNRDK